MSSSSLFDALAHTSVDSFHLVSPVITTLTLGMCCQCYDYVLTVLDVIAPPRCTDSPKAQQTTDDSKHHIHQSTVTATTAYASLLSINRLLPDSGKLVINQCWHRVRARASLQYPTAISISSLLSSLLQYLPSDNCRSLSKTAISLPALQALLALLAPLHSTPY